MSAHGAEASLIVLAVSVLIGGLAIHVGSMFALASRNYTHAVVTAVLGALAWALVHYLFGALDLAAGLSSVVGLVVWIGVVGWRYDAGWIRAAIIGLFAWVAALVTLAALAVLGASGLSAYGVPGA